MKATQYRILQVRAIYKTNKIVAHFVEQDEETVLLAGKIVDILNLIEK